MRTNSLSTVPVFYTPRMVADGGRFSPGARKPAPVVSSWLERGFPIDVIEPSPISIDDFKLAHEPAYVDGVFNLTHKNGFGKVDKELNETLPLTTGSMLCAARRALENKAVAVSPTAGFHHALYVRGAAYCTFNGLMVTAIKLLKEGAVKRVGVLDCDVHYGDGTQHIIDTLALQGHVMHFTSGKQYPRDADGFFAELPRIIARMKDVDLVLYQAGADPHINDPLGGFLDSNQLRERDRIVFSGLKALGVPIAWNLAGGYQQKKRMDGSWDISAVLTIHDATMDECCKVWGNDPASPDARRIPPTPAALR